MKILSTNIAQARTVLWNGNPIQTGIFKYPVTPPIRLGREDVERDKVIDRRYHGGIDKACYLYSADHYGFWREKYPNLEWDYGMFGENLTVQGLDEDEMRIGDIYKLGEALVQVSQPRQPCFKLGIRFGDQDILKEFIQSGFSGSYLRVLEEGDVDEGQEMILEERNESAMTVRKIFTLLYDKHADQSQLAEAIATPHLAESAQNGLRKRLRIKSN